MKSQLRVHFNTRADRTPLSVDSLSAGPGNPSVHFDHDHFHTWFSVSFVPRNWRNSTNMQPPKAFELTPFKIFVECTIINGSVLGIRVRFGPR